jgi:hypothetical protein
VFGGFFEQNDAGCSACQEANPYGGACGCPAGFSAVSAGRAVDDCGGAGSPQHGASLTVCETATSDAGSDFAGVYELDDVTPCNQGCRAPNPFTGGCSCPAGAASIPMRTLVDTNCGWIGATLAFCVRVGAPLATFGGAFQVDDPVAGGQGCRTSNPVTGGCSCPAGTNAAELRVEVDTAQPGAFIGSHVNVCTR